MIKYVCIKTFVAENRSFRRFYYGEDVTESLYLLLTQIEKNNFIKLTQ